MRPVWGVEFAGPPTDWFPTHDVCFAGREGSLTFKLGEGAPGQLACWRVEVQLGTLRGSIETPLHFDASTLRDQVRALLGSAELTGELLIAHGVEMGFHASLALEHGKGQCAVEVTSQYAMEDGSATIVLMTDQSFLTDTLRDLDDAARYDG